MSLIKIKKIKVIYNLKIRIRNIKYLFKDTLYLILNGSELSKIIDYIKNHFKIRRIQFNRDLFYKGKTFNHGDWFSHKIPLLINYFNNINKNNIEQILEIGSWEGRSSCFFLNYFKKSILTCVDTWKGSEENFIDDNPDLNLIEKNFDRNVAEWNKRLIKHKSESKNFFSLNRKNFDFIYIDGSHYYDDVLNDAQEGFKVLKENSYMLFDDYNWNFHKYGKNPINAINLFLKINKEQLKIIYVSEQVLIQKI